MAFSWVGFAGMAAVADAVAPAVVATCAVVGALSLLLYLVPLAIYAGLLTEQDLRDKYDAEWAGVRPSHATAVVTGGSSGIGASITRKLAAQGVNVVIVALGDSVFDSFSKAVRQEFPGVQFVDCKVDLSQGDYMTAILAATHGRRISLVFNNAGYIAPGLFVESPLDRSLRNYETNATCALKITHHFANLMLDRGERGLIAFTSSSSAFLPNPMASIYASTKAFLTAFATSIGAELRPLGIDVIVVHPSPIASRFLENATGFSAALASAKIAAPPSVVASALFRAAGRFVVYDQGFTTVAMKLVVVKLLDYNFVAEAMYWFGFYSGDWQKFNASRRKRPVASFTGR